MNKFRASATPVMVCGNDVYPVITCGQCQFCLENHSDCEDGDHHLTFRCGLSHGSLSHACQIHPDDFCSKAKPREDNEGWFLLDMRHPGEWEKCLILMCDDSVKEACWHYDDTIYSPGFEDCDDTGWYDPETEEFMAGPEEVQAWKSKPNEDARLEKLWDELEDIPFDEDGDGELILADNWGLFAKGTTRTDIWHWFDERHSKGVAWLLNDYPADKA